MITKVTIVQLETPGGIILKFVGENLNIDLLKNTIKNRLVRSAKDNLDIMIVKNDAVVEVIRYKK